MSEASSPMMYGRQSGWDTYPNIRSKSIAINVVARFDPIPLPPYIFGLCELYEWDKSP